MNSIVSFKRKIIFGLFVLLSVAQLPFSVSAAEFQWPKHGTISFEMPAGTVALRSPTLQFLFADTSAAALSLWNRDH
jgi:hypothetical protein